LCLGPAAPQQAGELVPRAGLARGEREIGQQCLRFACREADLLSGVESGFEAAEKS